MGYTVGVDIIELKRIAQALERWGERFLQRVYTEKERLFCRNRVSELAVRFAAKEAVMKALGTGNLGVAWREIEVLPMRSGKPLVYLHGRAATKAKELSLGELAVSLSHSRDYGVAMVVAEVS